MTRASKLGLRVTRYRGCFFFHEPKHTGIRRIQERKRYEPFVEDLCRIVLPDDGTVIDIGSNIGLVSIPLLRLKPQARALLFEPSPATHKILHLNVETNKVTQQTEIYECALADRTSDSVAFAVNDYVDGSMDGLRFTGRTSGSRIVAVTQRTLDEVIAVSDVSRVDLIKLDCEGAELLALLGAVHTIRSYRPVIVTEFSRLNYPVYGIQAKDLWDWARNSDYLVLLPNSAEVLTLEMLQICIGAWHMEEFALIPREHPWRDI